MKLKDFLKDHATRDLHNEGSRMDIEDGNYLVVLGPDSDVGRQVASEKYRIASEIDRKEDPDAFDDAVRRLFARLVKDWSFDEPITVDLVNELFIEYPFLYDRVVTHYSQRSNFTRG